jgi:hypothetical protein
LKSLAWRRITAGVRLYSGALMLMLEVQCWVVSMWHWTIYICDTWFDCTKYITIQSASGSPILEIWIGIHHEVLPNWVSYNYQIWSHGPNFVWLSIAG